ncbi:Coronin-like protein crn1 [Malassezia cuniculi]|uniref:Coronin n=1 Tax=Malassezia cuniculi TaxID=948313 RepID=A0AAF0EXA4_9BASI|nr:Coronin-like protein crn1 [Malassezia cuniculi]
MSGRFVRSSKYRHVYGNPAKKEVSYDNVKVSNNAWDTNLLSASGRYLSLNWQTSGGGAFALIPLDRPGKLPDLYPLCRGHTSAVLDTSFSPFDDNVLASGGDDGQVAIWNVAPERITDSLDSPRAKDGGMEDILPVATFHGGRRRVGHVEFHPTAANVLAAATGDHAVKLFDVEKQQSRIELGGFSDSIQSLAFDWTGSLLAATCRDRKLRLFDTRSRDVQTVDSHGGIKGARVVWCGDKPRIITTGFSKISERQMFLWDVSQLDKPIKTVSLDSSNGIIMPFWSDNNICFLAGKGDGNVRYYELESDELHYLSEYKSVEPQSGMTFLPRRALNVDENEIARAYKVTYSTIQPVSFYVPRKSDSFQEDIFPHAPAAEAALSAEEFFGGKTVPPKLLDFATRTVVAGAETAPIKVGAKAESKDASLVEPKTASTNAVPVPKAETTKAEPVKAEPAKAEPTKVEPTKVEPTKAEPTKAEPAKAEPVKAEPTKTQTSETNSAKNDSATSEPAKLEPTKSEPAKSEPAKSEPAKSEPAKPALTKSEPAKSEPAEPAKAQSAPSSADSAEIEALKAQIAERDARIRELEIEMEKLRTNQQRIRDVLILDQ